METRPLLFGIIGFLLGGFLVSLAALTFNKPHTEGVTMDSMVSSLKDKQGDDFDAAFIDQMIMHHQGAIDMAKLSKKRAEHREIKDLSAAIITAQEKEIADMKAWQKQWGYKGHSMNGGMQH